MKKIKMILICLVLIGVFIYSFANFEWYYYVWNTKYYEKVQDAYLLQFPQAREVTVEQNYLTTITLKCKDYFSLPKANIYINEHHVADFRNGQITLVVKQGDKIYIDTSYYQKELDFEVVATTGNVTFSDNKKDFTLLPQNNLLGEIIIDFPN